MITTDIDEFLDELFSSQDDWDVKTSKNIYIIMPSSNIEESDDGLGSLPKEAAEMKFTALNKVLFNLKLVPLTEDNEEPTRSE